MFAAKGKAIAWISALLLILSAILSACSSNSDSAPASSQAAGQGDKVITFSWARDIGEMNPHVYNPSQLIAQSMIYEPLVRYADGGKLEPHLAESWTISPDGKAYTFKLRQNVKFSDGTAFNAAIVKKNFDAIMRKAENHSWLGFIAALDKTEAVDEYTFKLTLKQAYYPTLQELAVVRPVRFLGEAGFPDDGDTSKGVKKPVGTGPWMLADYKKDEYAEFTRNPNYWGEQPKADKIVIKVIPDGETRVLAFEKGDLDLIYGEGVISMDAFQQLKDSGKYETGVSEPVGTRLMVMNTANAALSDLRVRLALQHGFNKQAMVDGVTAGLEEKADNILSTNFPYTDISVTPIGYDVEKAKAYLDEAGWKLPDGKTVREKEGKPLELELIYEKSDQILKPMAETLQAEWAAIGVKLTITGLDLTEQIKRFRAKEFDLNFSSNYGAPYDPHSFIHVVAENDFGFSAALSNLPEKDHLVKQIQDALSSTDEKKRAELYASILTTLQEQASLVPISYIKKTVVYHKNVSGFQFPANREEHPFNSLDIAR
ncbi:nickel ABC transporter, nickel/metallophore periplasmic binding protein [Cohnella sp. CFH 77786]|uniref:nickel ABC transporter substrate-binding protein n=1 Tax=Cohnella sp. CFH 77786 TaxID=2662265 RepID=UPI001C609357|nr:nickel ABC transporter substrate-binding protein [Cohnella sp. CFH 77786]MBW5447703.1 nickel ABC transporter, nickel/metallophore periplasmic binding protein [Cohnella sp. CFH 77786]